MIKLPRIITIKSMLLVLVVTVLLLSCKKEPGPGGKSTLYGKVLVKNYNSTFTVLEETYYAPNVYVYIIYGNDRDYGDKVRTAPGGVWEFKYLRPGSYKVYGFSKDSTLSTAAAIPSIREVTVPSQKQDIEVPDIVIFD